MRTPHPAAPAPRAAHTATDPTSTALVQLRAIMVRLRHECPWDREQTPQSLTRYAIEEAYEVDAAIKSGDAAAVCDELGDLLLQVLFQSLLHEEQGAFTLDDVMAGLQAKLVRRHPHVFGDADAADADAVSRHWTQIKAAEKAHRPSGLLDQVKPGPALLQAEALQKVAAKVGFDWPDAAGARAKIDEELAELDRAMATQDTSAMADELGDVLFSVVNLARKLDQDSEQALLGTVHKFRQRMAHMDEAARAQGRDLGDLPLPVLETLWQAAKQNPTGSMG